MNNIVDPATSPKAVLSPNLLDHPKNVMPAYSVSLNQAYHHTHILDHRRGAWILRRFNRGIRYRPLRICLGEPEVTLAIQSAFLLLARLCAVVRHTSFRRTLLAMTGTAPKGTTQVVTLGIGGLSEKENPAMLTSFQIGAQGRVGLKGGSQGIVIGQNGTANLAAAVPVRAKFVKRCDFY